MGTRVYIEVPKGVRVALRYEGVCLGCAAPGIWSRFPDDRYVTTIERSARELAKGAFCKKCRKKKVGSNG